MTLPRNILYYGKDEPLAERRPLRAGPLEMVFEEGDLRYVRLGRREVLRRVYVAVRDRNWGTVPPRLSRLRLDAATDSFQVSYEAEHRLGEIDFGWQGSIRGEPDGTITFTMDGEARSTFWRNRIGFCVLHPIQECAGCPCRVEGVDGTVRKDEFPRHIAAHAPFQDFRAISHEVRPGRWAEVRFAGEIFEMEDQRNWTDASFKTFGTPLARPYPVEVPRGTKIAQTVTLSLTDAVPALPAEPARAGLTLALRDTPPLPLPRVGLGLAAPEHRPTERELRRLRALNLAHLRLDLELPGVRLVDRLRDAHAYTRGLGLPLEVALLGAGQNGELEALAGLLETTRPAVCAWLVHGMGAQVPSGPSLRRVRRLLGQYEPTAKVGVGTNGNFVDLNRQPVPVDEADLVSYPINPQVHAFDNASLVENLEAQAATVASARRLLNGTPLAISPVTLRPRWNPVATGPQRAPGAGELPFQVDVRQMSLFGAGWTVVSLKYLAESGVASISFYETIGWRGVMEAAAGSPLPGQFRSLPGAVFPLYHIFADVGDFAGGEVLPTQSSAPLRMNGLALRRDGRVRLLLANLSGEPQRVRLADLGEAVWVKALDETNAEQAMRSPEEFRLQPGTPHRARSGRLELTVRPYAVVRVDKGPP
jgi:hypothetical protein